MKKNYIRPVISTVDLHTAPLLLTGSATINVKYNEVNWDSPGSSVKAYRNTVQWEDWE